MGIYFPLHVKVSNDIRWIYYPLDIKVNNDHHGDLSLGHLECPSWGATTPWAKSNMGEPLPPEDIAAVYHNHNPGIVSSWGRHFDQCFYIRIVAFLPINPSPTILCMCQWFNSIDICLMIGALKQVYICDKCLG